MSRRGVVWTLAVLAAAGCAPDGAPEAEMAEEPAPVVLGPVDGMDLPGTDLERVEVGAMAPDFTLASITGDPVTLSSYQGSKDVVLVFYRGHW